MVARTCAGRCEKRSGLPALPEGLEGFLGIVPQNNPKPPRSRKRGPSSLRRRLDESGGESEK